MHRNLILCLSLLMITCAPAGAQIVPKTGVSSEVAPVKVETAKVETAPGATKIDAGSKVADTVEKTEVKKTEPARQEREVVSSTKADEAPESEDLSDAGITFDSEKLAPSEPPTEQKIAQKPATPAAMVETKTASVPAALTSGDTVRQPGLQNAECLFNVIANGVIILGIAWAGPSLIMGFMRMGAGESGGLKAVMHVVLSVIGLMAMPGVINWLVAAGRDAGVFVGW